jgi:hypothetical protein
MAWFRVASNRLRYSGHLSRAPYSAWAKTAEGAEVIAARAKANRLYLFPRSRARSRMWSELSVAARSDDIRKAIQSETDHFANAMVEASHAPGLPRRTIAYYRLVVVPRSVVAARARTALRRRLFNDFFCDQLVRELDLAIGESRPSVSRPVLTRETWGCVGRDTEYRWVDPMFSGEGWGGHLLMFEFPPERLSRKRRKEIEAAVEDLQSSLSNINHLQRDAIVRIAVDGLPKLIH